MLKYYLPFIMLALFCLIDLERAFIFAGVILVIRQFILAIFTHVINYRITKESKKIKKDAEDLTNNLKVIDTKLNWFFQLQNFNPIIEDNYYITLTNNSNPIHISYDKDLEKLKIDCNDGPHEIIEHLEKNEELKVDLLQFFKLSMRNKVLTGKQINIKEYSRRMHQLSQYFTIYSMRILGYICLSEFLLLRNFSMPSYCFIYLFYYFIEFKLYNQDEKRTQEIYKKTY